MFMMSDGAAARPGPTDDFWYTLPGWAKGQRGGAEAAMRLTTVWGCIKVKSETIGHLPFLLYRRLPKGGKERATKHPLYRLLAVQPNPLQTSLEWRQMSQAHLDLRGNAYSRIDFKGPRITALTPMHPDRVRPELIASTGRMRYVYKPQQGPEQTFTQDEVLHLRGLATEGFMGLNPLEAERNSIDLTMQTERFMTDYFANDATPGGWIEHPTNFKDHDAREGFRRAWREAQAGRNRGRVAVLEYGLKYHEVGLKLVDAQFLEQRKYQGIEICRIYRMPPHKVQILDQAKWANIEQQSIDFVVDTMLPDVVRWEQRVLADLLMEDEQEEFFAEFLLDGLLRGDSTQRSQMYERAIKNRWMVPNEARARENLNPVDWGDEPAPWPTTAATKPDSGADPGADDNDSSKEKNP